MSKPGKSLKDSKQIILTKLKNIYCGDINRLCSKKLLDGYNVRLRASGISIDIKDFYIKQGDGYKLRKNYKQILNKKFNKKNQKKSLKETRISKKSLEDAKEIQQNLFELDNETKKKVELLQKELQERIRASLKKDQEEQEYAERLTRRLEVLNPNYENKISGTAINSEEEVNKILKRKNNKTNMLDSETMKPTQIKKIAKDINIPYKKIALALGLTGLGGGLIYMNTRKGKKKTKKNKKRKNKKRKFGTKSMTLDRYKVQVKNIIKKSLQKNKKVKDYHLKIRGCFRSQHFKGKNLLNFLRYYKEQEMFYGLGEMEIIREEYLNKYHKLVTEKYKKMEKIYNNLLYTTYENRLDIISIMQHPALTKEEKNFILNEIKEIENYHENTYRHFRMIIERLYPIPRLLRNLSLGRMRETLRGRIVNIGHLVDDFHYTEYPYLATQVEYFRNNNPEILWNKERLNEIMNDVYKKDINEEYIKNFLKKEKEKYGLFMDKDGILKKKGGRSILTEFENNFVVYSTIEKLNHFRKKGRFKDFSHIDLSGAVLSDGIFVNCNFKNANFKGANLYWTKFNEADLEGANLEKADLECADLIGANLQKANLRKANLQEANLQEADLQNADLIGANLIGASSGKIVGKPKAMPKNYTIFKGYIIGPKVNLKKIKLTEAILKEVNLQEANLEGASLHFCELQGANLEKANLEKADLYETVLSGANLQKAKLYNVIAEAAHLDNANLSGAILYKAYLQEADLQGANLKGANLERADLNHAYLQESDLQGANLSGANLKWADLALVSSGKIRGLPREMPKYYTIRNGYIIGPAVNLKGANLEGADLRFAELRRANLRGANLKGADLRGADLKGAELQGANLRGALLFKDALDWAYLEGANLDETIIRENQFLRRESQYDTSLQPDDISSDDDVELVGYDEGDVSALSGAGGIL